MGAGGVTDEVAEAPWMALSPGVEIRSVGDPGLYEFELRRPDLKGDGWVTWRVSLLSSTWLPAAGLHGEAGLRFMRVKRL